MCHVWSLDSGPGKCDGAIKALCGLERLSIIKIIIIVTIDHNYNSCCIFNSGLYVALAIYCCKSQYVSICCYS